MTQKQTALSQLARLALNAASVQPLGERADTYRITAVALNDDCPDLADLALKAAAALQEAADSQADLLNLLKPEA